MAAARAVAALRIAEEARAEAEAAKKAAEAAISEALHRTKLASLLDSAPQVLDLFFPLYFYSCSSLELSASLALDHCVYRSQDVL